MSNSLTLDGETEKRGTARAGDRTTDSNHPARLFFFQIDAALTSSADDDLISLSLIFPPLPFASGKPESRSPSSRGSHA